MQRMKFATARATVHVIGWRGRLCLYSIRIDPFLWIGFYAFGIGRDARIK